MEFGIRYQIKDLRSYNFVEIIIYDGTYLRPSIPDVII